MEHRAKELQCLWHYVPWQCGAYQGTGPDKKRGQNITHRTIAAAVHLFPRLTSNEPESIHSRDNVLSTTNNGSASMRLMGANYRIMSNSARLVCVHAWSAGRYVAVIFLRLESARSRHLHRQPGSRPLGSILYVRRRSSHNSMTQWRLRRSAIVQCSYTGNRYGIAK